MNNKLKTALIAGGVIASGIGGAAWLATNDNKPPVNTGPASTAQIGPDNIDKDCSDFGSHQEAQDYFESQGGSQSNNVDRLDRDGDGLACEAN